MTAFTSSHANGVSDTHNSLKSLISNLEKLQSSITDSLEELHRLEQAFGTTSQGTSEKVLQDTYTSETASDPSRCSASTLDRLREELNDSAECTGLLDKFLASYKAKAQSLGTPQKKVGRCHAVRLPLDNEDYERYGRQMIMPEIAAKGQMRLHNASVLVIGMGGLGCPTAAYLAGAGVGTLGLVDGDTVETSNLHRQLLHSTGSVGSYKVDSAVRSLRRVNPRLKYVAYRSHINTENALDIFASYDIILDCTDHPTSRYLISDAAVLCSKPLVSAAALRTDGQLMVLNNPSAPQGDSDGRPCYRCVFPKPPPPDSVISCGEGGVLGPVVGTMGILQGLEAIKILVGTPPSEPAMLMFSAFNKQPFRTVKLRGRKPDCPACSQQHSISRESFISGSMDYIQFCGVVTPIKVLSSEERISTAEYAEEMERSSGKSSAPLIDVRDKTQFDLCSFPGSINIPYANIISWKSTDDVDKRLVYFEKQDQPVTLVCRVGNDSQLAVRKLKDLGFGQEKKDMFRDIQGGWKSWKQTVDSEWPDY